MERRLHAPVARAAAADVPSVSEIIAIMGGIYLVLLALLLVGAAIALEADVSAAPPFIRMDDPAIAANFTA